MKCRGKAKQGEDNSAWSRVMRTCFFCGKEYLTKKYLAARSKYCSMLCLNRANAEASAKRVGPNCLNWKGGVTRDAEGYFRKQAPGHPYAHGNGYVLLHRLVLEEKLGRYLLSDEVSHHIDFDRTNNCSDNLMPMKNGEHTQYHKQIKYLFEHLQGG
jgi:hypothetical protein